MPLNHITDCDDILIRKLGSVGNLSLSHPLASEPLSYWSPVRGTFQLFVWQWSMAGFLGVVHIYQVSQSQCQPPPSPCWLHSETLYSPLFHDCHHLDAMRPLVFLDCHHSHVMSSWEFCFYSVSSSLQAASYAKGVQAVVFMSTEAAFAECYGQWSLS